LIEPRRFFPAAAIGGGVAGVAIAIPVIGDLLRCCFCIGVMAGAAASMKLWLDSHRAENLTAMEGATLGACSGAVTACVSWALSLPVRVGFGEGLSTFYHSSTALPELLRTNLEALYTPSAGMIVMSLPLQLGLYGVMGAVGGFLALQLAFGSRKAAE
jgi:hypothetical protein